MFNQRTQLPLAAAFLASAAVLIPSDATADQPAWAQYQHATSRGNVTLIHPADMADPSRLHWLVAMADRSTVTSSPIESDAHGLALPGDVFVITHDLLLWFNCNTPASLSTNGGGGMLRGLWPLHRDQSGELNFQRITNPHNYAPSLLYAGSAPGVQGSGISLLGNFGERNIDNGVTFAIEHEGKATLSAVTNDNASGLDEVLIQFTGHLANSTVSTSTMEQMGLEDHYDCDPRPGQVGRCAYTLSYTIPSAGQQFRQQIAFHVEQGNFGPCATLVLSHNLAGYPGSEVTFVAQPALARGKLNPADACFALPRRNLTFYTQPWTLQPHAVHWWEPSPGTGQFAGMGLSNAPYPVPFFNVIPAVDQLPPAAQSTYSLQFIDNQGANPDHRCLALDLQLWDANRPNAAPVTLTTGTTFQIETQYLLSHPSAPENQLAAGS